MLSGIESVHVGGEPDREAARRALNAATQPYRLFGRAALLLSGVAGALVILIVLCVAVVSANFRHRLFPRDLAVNSPWTASSAFAGNPKSGVGTSSEKAHFFHTDESDHPWLEIDLGGLHVVRSLTIENRRDCCGTRALPLNVDAWDGRKWRLIAQRRAPFSTWNYDVKPLRTNRIRLQVAGFDYFHLRRVSIYGT